MTRCVAVVPVKAFARAKSRLAGVLPEAERQAFARACFEHVLATLEAHAGIASIMVVSGDPEVLASARARGHLPLKDPSDAVRLNEVVDTALALAEEQGATAALVLMSDLPLLKPSDLDELLAGNAPLTLGPDHARAGTNALLVRPPDLMPTCFGDPQSFTLHRARAAALGCDARIVVTPSIAGDVDTAEDYAQLRRNTAG